MGYGIDAPVDDARWREVFNSDAHEYGGTGRGNGGGIVTSTSGRMTAVVPANGFVVLQRLWA